MQSVPLLRRVVFQHCTSTIDRLGFDAERNQARAGIPIWQYGSPDDLVPLRDVLRMLDLGANIVGDASFGLIVGEHNSRKLGTFGKIIGRSTSVYDACRKVVRLVKLLDSSAKFWIVHKPNGVLFCRTPTLNWQLEQYWLRQMVGLVEMSYDTSWRPSYVYVNALQKNDLLKLKLFRNTKIYAGQSFTAIFIPTATLTDSLRFLPQSAASSTERKLHNIPLEGEFAGSVGKIVESLLTYQTVGINTICEIIGVSRRTFQRELAKEHVIYRDLVCQTRYKIACKLLIKSDMPLVDIAHDTGYAGDTQLARAFVNLAGVTPGEFRAQHLLN